VAKQAQDLTLFDGDAEVLKSLDITKGHAKFLGYNGVLSSLHKLIFSLFQPLFSCLGPFLAAEAAFKRNAELVRDDCIEVQVQGKVDRCL
jgi:hypothetical protein